MSLSKTILSGLKEQLLLALSAINKDEARIAYLQRSIKELQDKINEMNANNP